MTATAEPADLQDLRDLRPIREAAEALDVSSRSIYNWIKAGILTEYKTPGGGKRLVDVAELRRKLRP
jgi:excisionase family DNA binding protein